MINKFPWWKNLLVFATIAIGFFYAIPNLYGEDPALQVSGTNGNPVSQEVAAEVENLLKTKNIKGISELDEQGQMLIRFTDTDTQIMAKDLVQSYLGDRYITALNLAPATPEFMRNLGMNPLKLGLDLRGGVHFLMEVDMDEAMKKMRTQLVSDLRNELRQNNIRLSGARADGNDVLITFRDAQSRDAAADLLKKNHRDFIFQNSERDGSYFIRAGMTEARLSQIRTAAVDQNINLSLIHI